MADNVRRRGKSLTQAKINELRIAVMDGLSNKEIATILETSEKSASNAVRNHARDIRRRRREGECTISCRTCVLPCAVNKTNH